MIKLSCFYPPQGLPDLGSMASSANIGGLTPTATIAGAWDPAVAGKSRTCTHKSWDECQPLLTSDAGRGAGGEAEAEGKLSLSTCDATRGIAAIAV